MKINSKISGNIDVFIAHYEEEFDGEIEKWDEILIHADPEGMRALANLLNEMADLNQDAVEHKHLPIGARAHISLRPGVELSKSSTSLVLGRLDAKHTGDFYERFIPKDYS